MRDCTLVRRDELRDFTGRNRDPAKIARDLGATFVVDGSVQTNASQLHVNVQVLSASSSGVHAVMSRSFDGTSATVFDLQRQIADGVAGAAIPGVLTTHPQPMPGTGNADALTDYWQGRSFFSRADLPGNVQHAIDSFHSAIARDPSFADARAALAEAELQLFIDTKDRSWYDQALTESQEAVRRGPMQPEPYIALARVYRQDGHTTEAIDALRRAIAYDLTNDNAREALGETLVANGNVDEGLSELRMAIALRPRFPGHHTRLGIALYGRGKYDDAIKELRTVTTLQPDNALAFHRLGTVYQPRGDMASALEQYGRAIQLGAPPATWLNMGVIQFDAGNYKDAAASFEQAVKVRPNFPQYRRNLGDAYRRLNRMDDARGEYTKCVALSEDLLKINPTSGEDISQSAVCLAKLGQFGEAIRRSQQAVTTGPKNGTWLYRQAVVLSFANRPIRRHRVYVHAKGFGIRVTQRSSCGHAASR